MKRVVVMDDSDLALEATAAALTEAGYSVRKARDLAELEQHLAGEVDLVLLDVHMPEAFGDDVGMVLRQVRSVRAPIYLYSTLTDEELARRTREAQVDGYVSKRDGLDAVVAAVRRALGDSV